MDKAIALSVTAGEREQAYIRAAALMRDKGRAAYIGEMEALIDRYPDDVEAHLFLARFLTAAARLQIRYGFWDEATKSLRQSLGRHDLKSSLSQGYLTGLLHFAQGMEAIGMIKPVAAESHLKALDDLIQQLASEKMQWGSDWYSGYGKRILEVQKRSSRAGVCRIFAGMGTSRFAIAASSRSQSQTRERLSLKK